MEYKVTVIIPTYNVEKFIHKTVNSIKNQTIGFENIELIIVDDNSTDSTKSILNEYEEKYPNVKCFYLKENTGSPSSGRNIGMDNASSKYIMFLDADDVYRDSMCEVLYKTIEEYNADIVTCRFYISQDGKNLKEKSILDEKSEITVLNSIDDDDSLFIAGTIWNKIYKRSFLLENDIHFITNEYNEDAYFSIQVYTMASKIVSLNKYYGMCYNLRESDDEKSISHTFSKSSFVKMYKGFKRILNYLDEINKSYPQMEYQLLIGFTKWNLLSECEDDKKIKIYKEFKSKYKEYGLFFRLENLPLSRNILMNCFMKFICFNEFTFKFTLKVFNMGWFKQKLEKSHFLKK